MHVLPQAGVGHDQLAAVEDEVTHQPVDEPGDLGGELRRLTGELGQRLGEPVADRHVAPPQRPQELGLVIAGDAQRRPVAHHPHGEPQHRRRGRTAVDEVADEEQPPAVGVRRGTAIGRDLVPEQSRQLDQLGVAAVHVTDDVEGAGVPAPVRPQGDALDGRAVDVPLAPEHPRTVEALPAQVAQ